MKLETWLLFVVTEAVLSMTPGPAVLFVLSRALQFGPGKSVWASGGILSANAAYFLLSATSLGAALAASHKLFFAIKWAGAAYLIYLGMQAFLTRSPALVLPAADSLLPGGWCILRDAFLLQGANPKALLFFVAILPQFINTGGPVPFQILILGLSSILVEFTILFIYGQLAGRVSEAARGPRFEKWTNRIAGCLLIAAAVGVAAMPFT